MRAGGRRRDFYMHSLTRRTAARLAFAGAAGFAFDRIPLFASATAEIEAYGPLRHVRAANSGEILLELPDGFQYNVLSRPFQRMSDGHLTPLHPDGMAAFEIRGGIRLVRNHEISSPSGRIAPAAPYYDAVAPGGCTTLVVDPATRTLVRDFVSLNGTLFNCAGGATPWRTWISCEEQTSGASQGFTRPHGYCFEVDPGSDSAGPPQPIAAMGRFAHEAVAVDPVSGAVYMTEDAPEAAFYRFLPDLAANLHGGGRLQALAVDGDPFWSGDGETPGSARPVVWIDLDPRDEDPSASAGGLLFAQARRKGAARFQRLEGAAHSEGAVHFVSTSGGRAGIGQVWRYSPFDVPRGRRHRVARSSHAEGSLTLLYESADASSLRFPDNVCVSPRGSLLLCEDAPAGRQAIRGLTREGATFTFARNVIPQSDEGEFAGATFSPDGNTLFVNVQRPGFTFAIWGDWKRGPL